MEITIVVIAVLLGLFLFNVNSLQVGYGQTGIPTKQQKPSINQSNSSNATSPLPASPLSQFFRP